jgi:hypothetical protein
MLQGHEMIQDLLEETQIFLLVNPKVMGMPP